MCFFSRDHSAFLPLQTLHLENKVSCSRMSFPSKFISSHKLSLEVLLSLVQNGNLSLWGLCYCSTHSLHYQMQAQLPGLYAGSLGGWRMVLICRQEPEFSVQNDQIKHRKAAHVHMEVETMGVGVGRRWQAREPPTPRPKAIKVSWVKKLEGE